jgi:hypothetical protein
MKLKVSAWMQDAKMTEANFKAEYHRALKTIASNSGEILKTLAIAAEIEGCATNSHPEDILPSKVKIPKLK